MSQVVSQWPHTNCMNKSPYLYLLATEQAVQLRTNKLHFTSSIIKCLGQTWSGLEINESTDDNGHRTDGRDTTWKLTDGQNYRCAHSCIAIGALFELHKIMHSKYFWENSSQNRKTHIITNSVKGTTQSHCWFIHENRLTAPVTQNFVRSLFEERRSDHLFTFIQ